MTTEETLSALLHELTPEPPHEITLDDIAARVARPVPRSRPSRHRSQPWLAALAAAAVVIAVAVALTLARPGAHHGPAGTHPPTATHTPTATQAPTPTQSAPSPGPALVGTVHLGGAKLRLPAGWAARLSPTAPLPTWCISHTTPSACDLWFRQVVGVPGRNFDPNAETAFTTPDDACGLAGGTRNDVAADVRNLGNRAAIYHLWTHHCSGTGRSLSVAQYVVPTAPGYVLFAAGDTATRNVMASIAASALLPAQTAPLPLTIMGSIESRTHQSDGYHVSLRPWDRVSGQFVALSGGTPLTFVIPDRLVLDNGVTLLGLIGLTTDGHHVTSLTIVGG